MRPSVVLPLQDPSPLSPFEPEEFKGKTLDRLKSFGYEGVELGITDPSGLNPQKIREKLESHGLSLSAITTGQAYGVEGISFTEPEAKKRRRAIGRIEDQIDFAAHFPETIVILGSIRGEGKEKEAPLWLSEGLKEVAQKAEGEEVKLAFEPINRYETKIVNTVEEALQITEGIDCESLGILFDTFHANIEEPSITASIEKAKGEILYVHVADSNRWPPGYGHLDFDRIANALRNVGYQGFLSLESLPQPDRGTCLEEGGKRISAL